MGLFAIGDLHFGFGVEKPMDIFGVHWKNHSERIIENWKREITEVDTVLLPGDISWGMRLFEAAADLDVIDTLPGKKILLSGNHDYWWKSSSKLSGQYPEMVFLKNDSIAYEDFFICGTRGWTCPNRVSFTKQDEKIYQREQIRLRLSLDSAMKRGAERIIVMLHYPPTNEKHEPSGFTELLEEYPVELVVYGHLHGTENHKLGLQGACNGITYYLTASDYLHFCPKRIL